MLDATSFADSIEYRSEATSGSPGATTDGPRAATGIDEDFPRRLEQEIPFLRQIVRRWHRDPTSADDLVQDTLVRALAGAHLWARGSNLRAWLFTIMRNQFHTSIAAVRCHAEALWLSQQHAPRSVPEGQSHRLELNDVESALRRLPAKQRLAILLVAVEGSSYEEAAETMQTSAAAVRCHLARGRERLREIVRSNSEHSPLMTARSRHPRATLRRQASALGLRASPRC
jgi:RNA polymerase sigma-70 factor (ECF subfamily)